MKSPPRRIVKKRRPCRRRRHQLAVVVQILGVCADRTVGEVVARVVAADFRRACAQPLELAELLRDECPALVARLHRVAVRMVVPGHHVRAAFHGAQSSVVRPVEDVDVLVQPPRP